MQPINTCAIIEKNVGRGLMNISVGVLFGFAGLLIGFNIPCFSFKIMEYKKGLGNVIKKYGFLYSKFFQLISCIFNGASWYFVSIKIDNLFLAFLVVLMISTGIIIAFIDVNIRIIPNELVLVLLILGLIFQLSSYGLKSLLPAFVSMAVMMAVFISVAGFVGFGKVGAGDVKLAAAMGLSLSYPHIVTAVIIMAIVLIVFIGVGFFLKKIYMTTMLPLAPFMISGYIFSLLYLSIL